LSAPSEDIGRMVILALVLDTAYQLYVLRAFLTEPQAQSLLRLCPFRANCCNKGPRRMQVKPSEGWLKKEPF